MSSMYYIKNTIVLRLKRMENFPLVSNIKFTTIHNNIIICQGFSFRDCYFWHIFFNNNIIYNYRSIGGASYRQFRYFRVQFALERHLTLLSNKLLDLLLWNISLWQKLYVLITHVATVQLLLFEQQEFHKFLKGSKLVFIMDYYGFTAFVPRLYLKLIVLYHII